MGNYVSDFVYDGEGELNTTQNYDKLDFASTAAEEWEEQEETSIRVHHDELDDEKGDIPDNLNGASSCSFKTKAEESSGKYLDLQDNVDVYAPAQKDEEEEEEIRSKMLECESMIWKVAPDGETFVAKSTQGGSFWNKRTTALVGLLVISFLLNIILLTSRSCSSENSGLGSLCDLTSNNWWQTTEENEAVPSVENTHPESLVTKEGSHNPDSKNEKNDWRNDDIESGEDDGEEEDDDDEVSNPNPSNLENQEDVPPENPSEDVVLTEAEEEKEEEEEEEAAEGLLGKEEYLDENKVYEAYYASYPPLSRSFIVPPKPESKKAFLKSLEETGETVRLHGVEHHSQAYNRLRRMFVKLKEGKNVTIAAIGGSPTAMGSYMYYLADLFKSFNFPGHVKTFNMGHGALNGNNAVFLMEQFMPHETDLVIYEFSVNDAYGTGKAFASMTEDQRKQLSYIPKRNFLHMVTNIPSKPLVIMVNIWSRLQDDAHEIVRVLEHEQFPHLLGTVDLWQYRKKFRGDPQLDNSFTVGDGMHPGPSGHIVIGELLKIAVSKALVFRLAKMPEALRTAHPSEPLPLKRIKAHCYPNETKQEKFMQILDFIGRAKTVPRSWSLIEPSLRTSFVVEHKERYKNVLATKALSTRKDRRKVYLLPECGVEDPMVFYDKSSDRSTLKASKYFLLASEKTPNRPSIPHHSYEAIELTLFGENGQRFEFKSPTGGKDAWTMNGKPFDTFSGPHGRDYFCGLQAGRIFPLFFDFPVTKVVICSRTKMSIEWFSFLEE